LSNNHLRVTTTTTFEVIASIPYRFRKEDEYLILQSFKSDDDIHEHQINCNMMASRYEYSQNIQCPKSMQLELDHDMKL
jgi:hypothetical protein